MQTPTIVLASGQMIPALGFGTFQLRDEACRTAVATAIEIGYRHIDTAVAYRNHTEVGAGIRDSGIARSDLWVTTKVPKDSQAPADILSTVERSLEELGLDSVDLVLSHWPTRAVPFSESFAAYAEVVERGLAGSVGISNYNTHIMREVAGLSRVPIVTNQVEFHPLLFQKELKDTCDELGVVVTAYSPLGRGAVPADDRLQRIAQKYGSTPGAVSLRWMMDKNIVVVPKATSREHIEQNFASLALELDPADAAEIDAFPDQVRTIDGDWKEYDF
jgi:diketogulonate reductase-like aldo/keto reductase